MITCTIKHAIDVLNIHHRHNAADFLEPHTTINKTFEMNSFVIKTDATTNLHYSCTGTCDFSNFVFHAIESNIYFRTLQCTREFLFTAVILGNSSISFPSYLRVKYFQEYMCNGI